MASSEQQNLGHVLWSHASHQSNILVVNKPLESHARSQLRCQSHIVQDKLEKKLVSIMNSDDKIGFIARLKKQVFSRHRRILSLPDHTSPVDKVGPDNNLSEIDATETIGLD